MKIRNGFVSNSSTSSYVIIIPSDDFENIVGEMQEFEQAIIREVVGCGNVCGVSARILQYISGNSNSLDASDLSDETTQKIMAACPEDMEENMKVYWPGESMGDVLWKYEQKVDEHPNGFTACADV